MGHWEMMKGDKVCGDMSFSHNMLFGSICYAHGLKDQSISVNLLVNHSTSCLSPPSSCPIKEWPTLPQCMWLMNLIPQFHQNWENKSLEFVVQTTSAFLEAFPDHDIPCVKLQKVSSSNFFPPF